MIRSLWLLPLLLCSSTLGYAVDIESNETGVSFENDVRPLLKAHCFQCHGEEDELSGGLDLRLRRFIAAGGDSGTSIVPGNRSESLLYQRIVDGEMPPEDKTLPDEDRETIGRWLDAGAPTARPEPTELTDEHYFTEKERTYWAFQPIQRPDVPLVAAADQVRTPIDRFLLARLEEQGLGFSPEACFDLTGLPPNENQIERFLADTAVDAYETLIDRLLASPQYGERWGRHWLDVAGYADSEGYANEDPLRNHAYKFRDYVVAAVNADKPFDVFIREQLAGDEMVDQPYKNLEAASIEKLVATGLLRMAPDGTGVGGVDQGVARNAVTAETIKIVSTAFLGLTVGCAQCHDHRYDPIPQDDYYRLRAIFEPALDWKKWRNPTQRLLSLYTDEQREQAAELEREAAQVEQQRLEKQQEYISRTLEIELAKLDPEMREAVRDARDTPEAMRTALQKSLLQDFPSVNVTAGSLYLYDRKAADELKALSAQAAEVRDKKPVEEFVRALTEIPGQIPVTYVFARGDHEQPKQAVEASSLSILANVAPEFPADDPDRSTTGRRLAYARWLTDDAHPLTARVIVNRVWMHHFGRGIVGTPGDFGVLGERPSHPELLDWLAREFVASGWSWKHLHKLIMTSTAYRQVSRRTAALDEQDPDNRLYGRMSVRRLEAEAVRDAVLAVGDALNLQMFGPAVPVMPDEVGQVVVGIDTTDSAGRPTGEKIPLNGQEYRRSIYIQARRSMPLAVLETFDAPIMEPNCEFRSASTVTPQALLLMNSNFAMEQSEKFAHSLRARAGNDAAAQISLAWRLVFSHEPTQLELDEALQYLEQQTEALAENPVADSEESDEPVADDSSSAELHALASLCHALISSNRFLYVD